MRRNSSRGVACALAALGSVVVLVSAAQADPNATTRSIAQSQANGLSALIVAGVQQAISNLPPSSGQSIVYSMDPALQVFARSERLAPASFVSPYAIGRDRFSVRAAVSYFDLAADYDPIPYDFTEVGKPSACCQSLSGLRARARVVVTDLSLTYGILDSLDLNLDVPIVSVDATGTGVFTSFPGVADDFGGSILPETAATGLEKETLLKSTAPLESLGARFSSGSNTGIGRVSVFAKWLAFNWPAQGGSDAPNLAVAVASRLSFPSPDEDQLAGSDSFALYPRAIAQLSHPAYRARLHADLGYEYDFSFDTLSRFAWALGTSVPLGSFLFDLGAMGSYYAAEVLWTARSGSAAGQREANLLPTTYRTPADTGTGQNLIDVVFGIKYEVMPNMVLVGNASAPVTDDGLRPDASGTLAVEYFF